MRFVLLLLLTPLLEIWLLIHVGSYLGAAPTVALVVLTAVVGLALIRRVGLSTLTRANQRIRAGEVPAQEMGEGLVLVVAAFLLIVPGFATDVLGLVCLIPPVRRRFLAPWTHIHKRAQSRRPGPGSSRPGATLEGEYRRDDGARRDERLEKDRDTDD